MTALTLDSSRLPQSRYAGGVDVGISLNYPTILPGGATFSLANLIDLAKRAEDRGFDTVYLADAPLGRQTHGAWDQTVLLGSLATATQTIRLATGILQPHHKNPVYLAAALATADTVSNGRTVIGIGIGSGTSGLINREYEATASLRGDTHLNGAWLQQRRILHYEESIDVIRRLWTEEWVSYQGQVYAFDNVTIGLAKPRQWPHPPIVLAQGIFYPTNPGGPVDYRWRPELAGKFVLGRPDRIARFGDGWTCAIASPSEVREAWSVIQTACVRSGRSEEDVRTMHRTYVVWVSVTNNSAAGEEAAIQMMNSYHGSGIDAEIAQRWSVIGNPDAIVKRLNEYVDAGITSFNLCPTSPNLEQEVDALARDVLPYVKRHVA